MRVARRHPTRMPSAANLAMIQRVCAFLHEHLGDGLSLRDLARMTQMSRSHLSRTTAVAVESGFYDLPHFDKAFMDDSKSSS